MIISINGKPGSGKSTVAKRLSRELDYERYYVGDMFREAARKSGMTLVEFLEKNEKDGQADKEFDQYVAKLGRTKNNFVIEGRMAFYFIPHSLKIFLDVTEQEGAKRIWLALQRQEQPKRNEDRNLRSYEDVLASVKERIRSDTFRYQRFYSTNIFDPQHYDLFLDTTNLGVEEEYSQVYQFIRKKLVKH